LPLFFNNSVFTKLLQKVFFMAQLVDEPACYIDPCSAVGQRNWGESFSDDRFHPDRQIQAEDKTAISHSPY